MLNSVNICGIPHKITEKDDSFSLNELLLGRIDYTRCEIMINKNATDEIKQEALYHEIIHGILMHLGYDEENNDERFVRGLSNAINQIFTLKEETNSDSKKV